jgi:hypothetical protein
VKNIAVILSILFLVLSVKPCSDGNNAEDLHQNEISANHSHQEDSDDSCPITCVCNCCGMAITYQPIQTFELGINNHISTEIISDYQSIYRFDFLSNIWQPPQLMT